MKVRIGIMLLLASVLLIGCADSVEKTNNSERETESESGTEFAERIITKETDFQLWSDRQASHLEKEADIFENFSLAEYHDKENVYPVLYNEDTRLIFYEKSLVIVILETQDVFLVTLPTCSNGDSILHGNISVRMCDVNQDNVDEIIVTEIQTGTCRIQYVDVIDMQNKKVLPFAYEVDELAALLPEMEVQEEKRSENDKWESIVVAYQMQGTQYTHVIDMKHIEADSLKMQVGVLDQDFRQCSKDGKITVEAGFGFAIPDSVHTDYVGKLVGTLIYNAEEQKFVLDKESVLIEWNIE